MQRIDLNVASRPFRNNTLPWVGLAVAVIALSLLTYANVGSYFDYRSRLHQLEDEVSSIESRRMDLERRQMAADRAISRIDIKDLQTQADKANDVIRRKALSWTQLFNRLESVLPVEAYMVSVRPVFRSRGGRNQRETLPDGAVPVTVDGVGRNFRGVLDFEQGLWDDAYFAGVEPDRISRNAQSGEILFTLRFLYFSEGNAPTIDGDEAPAETTAEVDGAPAEEDEPQAPSAESEQEAEG